MGTTNEIFKFIFLESILPIFNDLMATVLFAYFANRCKTKQKLKAAPKVSSKKRKRPKKAFPKGKKASEKNSIVLKDVKGKISYSSKGNIEFEGEISEVQIKSD